MPLPKNNDVSVDTWCTPAPNCCLNEVYFKGNMQHRRVIVVQNTSEQAQIKTNMSPVQTGLFLMKCQRTESVAFLLVTLSWLINMFCISKFHTERSVYEPRLSPSVGRLICIQISHHLCSGRGSNIMIIMQIIIIVTITITNTALFWQIYAKNKYTSMDE